jgi:hypothetical protein
MGGCNTARHAVPDQAKRLQPLHAAWFITFAESYPKQLKANYVNMQKYAYRKWRHCVYFFLSSITCSLQVEI